MRNWCAALVMSALLALPLCAQQKNSGARDDTTNAAANAEKNAASGEADSLSGTGCYVCGLASTRHARSPVRARGNVRLREFRARRSFLEL